MTFSQAVSQATNHLIRSKAARTASGETLTLSKTEYNSLMVEDWGWDRAEIAIPTERPAMIARKCRLQVRKRDALDNIELRYILDILHREAR